MSTMPKQDFKRHTITAALPYANGPKHVGHLAGAYLPADFYVRYLRQKGREVAFICGSDEHGAAITLQAIKEKTTPKAIVDKYHALLIHCFDKLGISFDIYHRTSAPIHHETAQAFFTNLFEKGLLEEDYSEQYFDEEAQVFLADRYIQGTCPICGNADAYGDQCEKCGSTLSPKELLNPRSTLSGGKPILKPTKHWYLPLQHYEAWLKEWILEGHKDDWKPSVYGQVKSWIDSGLQARAVTRDLEWGIKVPLPDAEGKVLYVWFDAPIGYISATKQWAKDTGQNWETWWKDPETRLIHFIGKDNIVFHCIIFPAMLKAHGEFILPDNVPASEFMNLEGDKMSTSRGWSVEMHEYIEDFPDKPDALRYYLGSNIPEAKDSEFTWKEFQAKYNNELADILGNFINRAVVLTHKYYGGEVPKPGAFLAEDKAVLEAIAQAPNLVADNLENFKFRAAQAEMMNLARAGNKYLADTEPWKLVKNEPERVKTIMYLALQVAANVTILAQPFIPFTAEKLKDIFKLPGFDWNSAGKADLLPAGNIIEQAPILFQKITDEEMEVQLKKLHDKAEKLKEGKKEAASELAPAKPAVTFDDFAAMDIRVATILEAEAVPKTQKLLKLKLDTGLDVRTVVSGIAEYFQPEHIVGKQVCLLANLAPRLIKGIESQGMILMAKDADGRLEFVSPASVVGNGSGVS